ncbi:MAG: dTDP-4-dehydrorhamnose 3,5-epimerase [Bacteroidetes bacterium]|nr:dTDP-4-dehydrorhamnose 3,5-epimerase [Bacteroidota bacterium]
MEFQNTSIDGLVTINLKTFEDDRGWFARTFCKREFGAIGHTAEWTQMNHSFTKQKATIRGLHYQIPPFSEVKMIRCIAGEVFDVAIDLREHSKTFLQWHGEILSAKNRKMLYIPAGFAHGFQTLSEDCELIYHHTSYYEPNFEAGIRYDDPVLNVQWPLPPALVSERDRGLPYLSTNFKGIQVNL